VTSAAFVSDPWWTDADQAEFELLVFEFFGLAFVHYAACPTCLAGKTVCTPYLEAVHGALNPILEWMRAREARSHAQWVREREAEIEWRRAQDAREPLAAAA
jgi:hypothetical protein